MKNQCIKSYAELMSIPTFEERFKYLKTSSLIGDETFGAERYLNQDFYTSDVWKTTRRDIIVRDLASDLAMGEEYTIYDCIVVHHINPITIDDIICHSPKLIDPNNLIVTSGTTHRAIHYGGEPPVIHTCNQRFMNDTCPWRR